MPRPAIAHKTIDSLYAIASKGFKEGDYDVLLETMTDALTIAEQEGSCADKAMANMRVGRAYYHLQQRDMALRYMKISDSLGRGCDIDSIQWLCARQIGAILYEKGRTDSSLLYLHKADRLLNGKKEWIEHATLYCIMGEVFYSGKKEKAKGKYYFDLAEKYAVLSKNAGSLAYASMKQGLYATLEKDCQTGIRYFQQAWQQYKEAQLVEGEMYAMKCLAMAMSECGRAQETYSIMAKMQSIRDSIFKAQTADNAAKYRTLYETEKKEKQNAELTTANTLKQLQIEQEVKSRRMLLMVFALSLMGLGAVFILFWSRYRLKKQKELDSYLARQQQMRFEAVIEAEENERKRIAGDLHDGVGQIMSAAKINLSVLGNDLPFDNEQQRKAYDKIVALVDESCKEVRSVSHNMMPNVLLKSGLADAVRTFIGHIDGRVMKVNFYTEGLNTTIDANIEVILYRVIQECVNNVIKHSEANRLDITLIKDSDGISATIEDNGRGFDTTRKEHFEGIGLKNIISRIAYLGGSTEWNSALGKGTAVVIQIPVTS